MPDKRRATSTRVYEVLDYTLANPKASFVTITEMFQMGKGTLISWTKPQSSTRSLHPAVVKWMKEHGPEWLEVRSKNQLGPRILKIANKAVRKREFKGNQADPLTSGLGPKPKKPVTPEPKNGGVFQPQTAGDLVVLEKEVEGMVDRAKVIVTNLESVLTSIKITVQWTSEIEGRVAAEKKILELENLVGLVDKTAREAQTEILNNKMLERFGHK